MRFITITNGIELSGNPPSGMYRFIVTGTDDESVATSYAITMTPATALTTYGVLYRDDVRLRRTAFNHWSVEVPYGTRKNITGDWTWDFDTTGGTVHITQAKEEIARYPTATAPDQLGAIAVNEDKVEGTEIVIPALKINVQFRHPLGVVTLAKVKSLRDVTGMVNSDTFLTFAAGEVLFLGARGSDGSDAEATINYSFAIGKNLTGQTIGSIASIAKKAWEVAWIRYHDTTTTADGKENPTRVPKYVYIDRVYETTALATALGFGG